MQRCCQAEHARKLQKELALGRRAHLAPALLSTRVVGWLRIVDADSHTNGRTRLVLSGEGTEASGWAGLIRSGLQTCRATPWRWLSSLVLLSKVCKMQQTVSTLLLSPHCVCACKVVDVGQGGCVSTITQTGRRVCGVHKHTPLLWWWCDQSQVVCGPFTVCVLLCSAGWRIASEY